MRMMAVMAHPDDAEIWCGGTLTIHAEKGDIIRICTLSYTEDSVRGREALEGANRMGCEVELLGLKDTSIRDSDEAAEKLRRSMDSFRPDIIITHWLDDMHPDHEATFRVLRRALVCGFLGKSLDNLKGTPRIFCCDTYGSMGLRGPFMPDQLVDVKEVWEKKKSAIQAHESQPLPFYLDMIEQQCLIHGRVAGTELAEGFLYVPLFDSADDGINLG
jgi:N-acetylglucosamine malate deacetylase 1